MRIHEFDPTAPHHYLCMRAARSCLIRTYVWIPGTPSPSAATHPPTATEPHLPASLVNEANIRTLTRELLDYLAVSDAEFKPDLTAKICMLIQRWVRIGAGWPGQQGARTGLGGSTSIHMQCFPRVLAAARRVPPNFARAHARRFAPDRRWHLDQLLAVMLQVRGRAPGVMPAGRGCLTDAPPPMHGHSTLRCARWLLCSQYLITVWFWVTPFPPSHGAITKSHLPTHSPAHPHARPAPT